MSDFRCLITVESRHNLFLLLVLFYSLFFPLCFLFSPSVLRLAQTCSFFSITSISQVHWLRKRSLLNPSKILNERHSLSFPGKRKHAVVPQLEPFSEYSLTVNVYNKKGNGPNSDPVIFSTPEGGKMTHIRTPHIISDSLYAQKRLYLSF